jgi:hypothetical protein
MLPVKLSKLSHAVAECCSKQCTAAGALKPSWALHDCLHKLRGCLSTTGLVLPLPHAFASPTLGKQAYKQKMKKIVLTPSVSELLCHQQQSTTQIRACHNGCV